MLVPKLLLGNAIVNETPVFVLNICRLRTKTLRQEMRNWSFSSKLVPKLELGNEPKGYIKYHLYIIYGETIVQTLMKRLILITFIGLFLISGSQILAEPENDSVLKENDYMEEYTLEDQFGTLRTLKKETEEVIISFDMNLSKTFHKWLENKEGSYLADRKTEYIIDVTGMPSIITWLFAGPKMRKYGFQILLIKEEGFGDKFPKQEGKFTVIKLDSGHRVANIGFINSMDEIAKIIE